MRRLDLQVAKDGKPAYLAIAEAVRGAIQTGRLGPGDLLPSTRSVAESAGVHRHTVMAAFDELVAEGWITARERKAFAVCDDLQLSAIQPFSVSAVRPAGRTSTAEALKGRNAESHIAFESGQPDLRAFPFAEFASHITASLRRPAAGTFAYGRPAGHPPFLEALAEYLRRLRGLVDRPLLVTHGSQEALAIASRLLAGAGDVIAVEALGYPPAWGAFRATGARLVGVPVDDGGIDPDAFDKLCRRTRPKLLYVTPLHQYPTTATLTAARRLRLYDVAARHGVPILEDDYDHEFHYRCQPLPPLAAHDPAGIVVYVSTFTKSLFPSTRLGYLALPERLYRDALTMRRYASGQNDALMQDAVARWIRDGGLERHLRRMRRLYDARLTALDAALQQAVERGAPFSWRIPDGGMALWLKITSRRSSKAVAAAAKKRGVLVHSEEDYRLDAGPGHHLRLGFAARTEDEIRSGIRLLAEATTDR